ncbi:hypothetical protein [Pararhodobacter oceanensis]|uniref:hypothetical protein n=1 Tax=Pararhodobacter oceanensis TaxID=2172121 RepID=UPI003A8CD434
MQHQWIISMLNHLQEYSQRNALPELASQLEQAQLLAMVEIANLPDPQTQEITQKTPKKTNAQISTENA